MLCTHGLHMCQQVPCLTSTFLEKSAYETIFRKKHLFLFLTFGFWREVQSGFYFWLCHWLLFNFCQPIWLLSFSFCLLWNMKRYLWNDGKIKWDRKQKRVVVFTKHFTSEKKAVIPFYCFSLIRKGLHIKQSLFLQLLQKSKGEV